jgi:hypothetical protein
MKRMLSLFAVLAMVLGTIAMPAAADQHDQGPAPLHGHMLVQRPIEDIITIEGVDYYAAVGFRKCVDLAAGRALPLHAHHHGIHTGNAGMALAERAGHATVPTAPLTPWANCAELEAALPIIFGPVGEE